VRHAQKDQLMAEIELRRQPDRPEPRRKLRPHRLDDWLRRQSWMEGVADAVHNAVGATYGVLGAPGRALKGLLYGTKALGHPLHPTITDLPMGAWTVGVVADYVGRVTHLVPPQAGDIGLAVGIVAALGAVATGYTDFYNTYGQERRYGLTHAAVMTTSTLVMIVSLGVRWLAGGEGAWLAIGLATFGLLLTFVGAYFGGHLTFGFGTMVNHLAFVEGPEHFVDVGAPADFGEGTMHLVDAGGMPALLARLDGRIYGIADVCSHAGGPLHEGKRDGDVVTCPWHGSRFCLRNGQVLSGPATFDQPALDVEEVDGIVRVKLNRPLH
jgi:nitrite reductase/ring-hydroxylating ferredoxin subunit/uncharacterized membrane protein